MLRTTTLSAAALLGAVLLTPTSASAAGETCQGRPATIVGADRATPIVGTDGPDVIVSTGARVIDARGGDDLVCVVNTFVRDLDAGDGDDVVDVSAGYGAWAVLGAGSDTFIGSPGGDWVWAGTRTARGEIEEDTEADVIDTGAEQSADRVYSGEPGVPNGDQVRVGALCEVTWAGTPTSSTVLESAGAGDLDLTLTGRDRVRIDNTTEVLTLDGRPTALSGFTAFTVHAPSGPRSFSFLGNDRGYEYLTLDLPRPRTHRVDMGGGRNELDVTVGRPLAKGTRYRAGSGRDGVRVTLVRGEVRADLGTHRLTTRLGRTARTTRVTGFESAAATAQAATLVGTPGRNGLYVAACRGHVVGLAGGDSLGAMQPNTKLRCARRSVTAIGGPGKDHLTGSPGPDRLIGGAGKDVAGGRGGRDTCEAESTGSCERKLWGNGRQSGHRLRAPGLTRAAGAPR